MGYLFHKKYYFTPSQFDTFKEITARYPVEMMRRVRPIDETRRRLTDATWRVTDAPRPSGLLTRRVAGLLTRRVTPTDATRQAY
nr:hypothetical protein Itr_chr02CG14010 [Ipomoea trifida]